MNTEGFKCILCGSTEQPIDTGFRARDDESVANVKCVCCGHNQLFPHMTREEYIKEYDEGTTFKSDKVKIAYGADVETARIKWAEWNKKHVDMYFDIMQQYSNVLDLGAGFGFFEETLNNIPNKSFEIEGVEIGEYRLNSYVGGHVHNINFLEDDIPKEMIGKYDLIISMHLLEHLYDPVSYLKKIKPLVKSGGKLIFEMPNNDCYLKELSKEYAEFFI